MKLIANIEFPENRPEFLEWKPTIFTNALHCKVLCVAHTRVEGAFAAYIFPVPGVDHEAEAELWETEGAKLREAVARVLFPMLADLPYAR